MQQNSLKEHYAQAEAIVSERQAEMNSNLARIATDRALRDANDLIQKQRKDILDYQEAMTRMDALENAVGQLCLVLQEKFAIDPDPVMDLIAVKEVVFNDK
jgi:hypothetical protein